MFKINNKATKRDLRRILLTCGEVEDVKLITKPLPDGTKWAYTQFKKRKEGMAARNKLWKMMREANIFTKQKCITYTELTQRGNSGSEMLLERKVHRTRHLSTNITIM